MDSGLRFDADDGDIAPAAAPLLARVRTDAAARRWHADVRALAGMNRYALRDGVDAARDWLCARLRGIGLDPELEPVEVAPRGASGTAASDAPVASEWERALIAGLCGRGDGAAAQPRVSHNIVARLPGADAAAGAVLVGAHYDSISDDPGRAAPGGLDNATGVATVLRVAAALRAGPPPRRPHVFALFTGEEQGCVGSAAHAAAAPPYAAVVCVDMVGWGGHPGGAALRVRTDAAHRRLLRVFRACHAAHCALPLVEATDPGRSDHVSFLGGAAPCPAAGVCDNGSTTYAHYHRTTDHPDNGELDPRVAEDHVTLTAAALAQLDTGPIPAAAAGPDDSADSGADDGTDGDEAE